MSKISELPMKFSNIVLHQADVTSSNDVWIKKLQPSLEVASHFEPKDVSKSVQKWIK